MEAHHFKYITPLAHYRICLLQYDFNFAPFRSIFALPHLAPSESISHTPWQRSDPTINLLANHILDIAFILGRNILLLQRRRSHIRLAIHGLLQTVIFPPEDVVGVCAPAEIVCGGPCKGLEEALVVEIK
jgi:hypothetical protein